MLFTPIPTGLNQLTSPKGKVSLQNRSIGLDKDEKKDVGEADDTGDVEPQREEDLESVPTLPLNLETEPDDCGNNCRLARSID